MFNPESPELLSKETITHNTVQIHSLDDDLPFSQLLMWGHINDFNRELLIQGTDQKFIHADHPFGQGTIILLERLFLYTFLLKNV
jgi:hypothetical protein